MEENGKEGGRRMGDFLYSWKIFYPQEQQVIIDRFSSWCKERGYRQISGLLTLMEMADHYRDVSDLAIAITELNKKVTQLESKVESLERKNKPITMGGG